jgi:hypothetical protein
MSMVARGQIERRSTSQIAEHQPGIEQPLLNKPRRLKRRAELNTYPASQ